MLRNFIEKASFIVLKRWKRKHSKSHRGSKLSRRGCLAGCLPLFRLRCTCVGQNLCHSAFCTLIWQPWTRHSRHFGLCHWFGIELCAPCPSLSVEINDACFWPCIKIQTHTHTPSPFLPRTLTCAFNLLYKPVFLLCCLTWKCAIHEYSDSMLLIIFNITWRTERDLYLLPNRWRSRRKMK